MELAAGKESAQLSEQRWQRECADLELRVRECLVQMDTMNMNLQICVAAKNAAESRAATMSEQRRVLVKEIKQLRHRVGECQEREVRLKHLNEQLCAAAVGLQNQLQSSILNSLLGPQLLSPTESPVHVHVHHSQTRGEAEEEEGSVEGDVPRLPPEVSAAAAALHDALQLSRQAHSHSEGEGDVDGKSSSLPSSRQSRSASFEAAAAGRDEGASPDGYRTTLPSRLLELLPPPISPTQSSDGLEGLSPVGSHPADFFHRGSAGAGAGGVPKKSSRRGLLNVSIEAEDGIEEGEAASSSTSASSSSSFFTGALSMLSSTESATIAPGPSASTAHSGSTASSSSASSSSSSSTSFGILSSMFTNSSSSSAAKEREREKETNRKAASALLQDQLVRTPIGLDGTSESSTSPTPSSAVSPNLSDATHGRLPSALRLTCLRCSGTVEGPKFSTCRCKVPALSQQDLSSGGSGIQVLSSVAGGITSVAGGVTSVAGSMAGGVLSRGSYVAGGIAGGLMKATVATSSGVGGLFSSTSPSGTSTYHTTSGETEMSSQIRADVDISSTDNLS